MRERNFSEFLTAYASAEKMNECFVVVTMVKALGSAPQEVGARLIATSKGLFWGTVGGGKVEARALSEALQLIEKRDQKNHYVEWNLQKDIGMTCGGVAGFFLEKHDPQQKWQIAIFGAGHVGQALVSHLLPLDCEISIFDSRSEWIDKLPEARNLRKVCTEKLEEKVSSLPDHCFVIIMTMGHATDLPILVAAMKRNFPYVGNMGSEQKARVLHKDLKNAGIEEASLGRLHCPIGEPLGGNSPHEIALSVAAQLLKVRDQAQKSTEP